VDGQRPDLEAAQVVRELGRLISNRRLYGFVPAGVVGAVVAGVVIGCVDGTSDGAELVAGDLPGVGLVPCGKVRGA
jgi:hypothetical protein